jgi:hypothetical protein
MNLSKNLSLKEATKSITAIRHGIENLPGEYEISNLEAIAECVFQPLRDHFGVPIAVTSGFRSKELNRKIGGSSTSQHMVGEALDLDAHVYGNISNADIFKFIYTHLNYDQLIWEFGDNKEPDWIHVSYKRSGENRNRTLKAVKEDGVTTYILMQ